MWHSARGGSSRPASGGLRTSASLRSCPTTTRLSSRRGSSHGREVPEDCPKRTITFGGKRDETGGSALAQPPALEESAKERGAEGTCQMGTPLAPVEAAACKRAASAPQGIDIDALLREPSGAPVRHVEQPLLDPKQSPREQGIAQFHAESAREMVVAGTSEPP